MPKKKSHRPNKKPRIEREIEIVRVELCERLIPHVHSKVLGAKTATEAVKVLLTDSLCATAFGYRFKSKVRATLGPSGETGEPGSIFRSTVLHRALVYMKFVSVVFRILGYQAHSNASAEILDRLLQFSPDDYNTVEQLERFVRTQLSGTPAENAYKVLKQALEDGGRVYIDRSMDAALWLLTPGGVARNDDLVPVLCIYLTTCIEQHLRTSEPEPIDDPATLLWALVALRRHRYQSAAWCNNVLSQLIARPALTKMSTRTARTDLDTAPELFEQHWRSDAFCVFDLATLTSDRDIDRTATARLLASPLRHMFRAPHPPRRNLHFLAQRLLALETLLPQARVTITVCKSDITFEKTVLHATEINLADYRVMGDYLVWRDSPGEKTAIEKEIARLQELIRTYVDNKPQRPVNILLWAPPGSGKSFFVKNVLKEEWPGLAEGLIEINAAQMSRPEELTVALRHVTSKIAESGRAAFFLDEADTDLPATEANLYPYLLMPMWDGEYLSDGNRMNMKQLIWFTAVSSGASLDDFMQKASSLPKGKDFLSRIHRQLSLPPLDARAQLLVFLGNLLRLHRKTLFVERAALRHIAEFRFEGGARAIEKAVMLLPLRTNDTVLANDLAPLLPSNDASGVTLNMADRRLLRERVAVVDL